MRPNAGVRHDLATRIGPRALIVEQLSGAVTMVAWQMIHGDGEVDANHAARLLEEAFR